MTLEPTLVMRQIPSVLLLMLSSLTKNVSKGTVRDYHSSQPYGTGWDIGAVLAIGLMRDYVTCSKFTTKPRLYDIVILTALGIGSR